MDVSSMKNQLVEMAASLFFRGYSVGGAGNISLLLPDGNILATPTGACLGRLKEDDLSITDQEGGHLSGSLPTKEIGLHVAAYKARPDCKAVVHLHSTCATALSCLADINTQDAIHPFTPYYVMKIKRLPVAPYYKPGSSQLAQAASKLFLTTPSILLANHGLAVCGTSLSDAVNRAEELEETAKIYFMLHASCEKIRYLSEGEISELS